MTENLEKITIPLSDFSTTNFENGIYVVCLYTKRIPPHIGMCFDGKYHSLSIKGAEVNIPTIALLKTIQQKKIESVFFEIVRHPVYSTEHLSEIFKEIIKQEPAIDAEKNTCLKPVKKFFMEYFAVPFSEKTIILDFIRELKGNDFILSAKSLNLDDEFVHLPRYSQEELNQEIRTVRSTYHNK